MADAGMIADDVRCIQCGYALFGLPRAGKCPECAMPAENSLRGTLLPCSSPEYVAKLHRGVVCVLAGIVLLLLEWVGAIFFGIVLSATSAGGAIPAATVDLLWSGMGIIGSLLGLYGWWRFSEPDPRFIGVDTGQKPRILVRITVAIVAATTILNFSILGAMATQGAPSDLLLALAALSTIVGFIAHIVKYFASMLYVRWIAGRIPNEKAHNRAKTLLWLGPALMTVGMLLLFLGPLIALVLYYNLLDLIRRDLKRIRASMASESLLESAIDSA